MKLFLFSVTHSLTLINKIVKFQVLSAASIKMTVLCVVAPLSLVEVCRRFIGACYLVYQSLMMESASDAETLQKPRRQHLNKTRRSKR